MTVEEEMMSSCLHARNKFTPLRHPILLPVANSREFSLWKGGFSVSKLLSSSLQTAKDAIFTRAGHN